MTISVQCECGLKYKVREDKRGTSFRCQGCDAAVTAPELEHNPDDEWDDLLAEEPMTAAAEEDDEWDNLDDPFARPRRKPKSNPDGLPKKGGKRKSASPPPDGPNKKFIIIMSSVGGATLLTIVLLIVFLAGSAKNDAGADGGGSDNPNPGNWLAAVPDDDGAPPVIPNDGKGFFPMPGAGKSHSPNPGPVKKQSPIPEHLTVLVAHAKPAKGLSAPAMLASSKPPKDWSVKVSGRNAPENLGSVWYVPPGGPAAAGSQASLLPAEGRRAAMLVTPYGDASASLYEIDLTRPGAVKNPVGLAASDDAPQQPRRRRSIRGTIWRGLNNRRVTSRLFFRDRTGHVAAVNPAFTRIANGLHENSVMQVWDNTGKRLAPVAAPAGSHWVFAGFADNNSLCLIASDGAAQVVDPTDGKVKAKSDLPWKGWVAMTPDRKYVLGSNESAIEFRDARTLKLAGSLAFPPDLLDAGTDGPSLDVSTDGQRLAALFVSGDVYALLAWDLKTGTLNDVYLRKSYGKRLWAQWVGKRRVLIAGGSQIRFSVVDLDRLAVVYYSTDITPVPSVDGRIWRCNDRVSQRWLSRVYPKLTGQRASRYLPPLVYAGKAVPDRVEKQLAEFRGIPVNRNLPVRVEVIGRKTWPLKETADGFTAYLTKYGFTVDPKGKVVYRLILGYKSIRINRTGLIGPAIRGNPGVAFSAKLDLGKDYKGFTREIYQGIAVTSEGRGPSVPEGLNADTWENQYPVATKKVRAKYLESIRAVMENRAGGLPGVGSSSDKETYFPLNSSGSYSVPRSYSGDFPIDGVFQP